MTTKRKRLTATDYRERLPKHMRIGVYRWTIELWDPEKAEAENEIGQCDTTALVIRVRTDITNTRFAECLMHEIGHACWFCASLNDSEEEETVVERLTPMLLQARRDNPKVFKFIDAAIAEA